MPQGLSSMKRHNPLNSRSIVPCGSKNLPGFLRSFIKRVVSQSAYCMPLCVHRPYMCNALPALTTIGPTTACRQRNDVETYSKSTVCQTFLEDETMNKFAFRVLICCLVLTAFTLPSLRAQVQEPAENKGTGAADR